jgi:hypothetical protein
METRSKKIMEKTRPVVEIALEIFKKEGKPIHYIDLTNMILEKCTLSGKTPHMTVRSRIGTDGRFKRIAEGVYALSEWDQYPVARFAKDIAYEILSGSGESMLLQVLGNKILNERKFAGAPKQIAKSAVRSDSRFYYHQEFGKVGLVEWSEEK